MHKCAWPPGRETLTEELHYASLSLLTDLKQASNTAFGALGLTYAQALLLTFIEQGVTRPKDLAQALGVVPQALSALVSRLTHQGLLERNYRHTDGRRVDIRLTSLGKDLCHEVNAAWRACNPIDMSGYSDDDIKMPITVATQASKRQLT